VPLLRALFAVFLSVEHAVEETIAVGWWLLSKQVQRVELEFGIVTGVPDKSSE
jgi:hypothetical protein